MTDPIDMSGSRPKGQILIGSQENMNSEGLTKRAPDVHTGNRPEGRTGSGPRDAVKYFMPL